MTPHPPPIVVERASNAPEAVLAAVEEAIEGVARVVPVDLTRVRGMSLPRGEPIWIRGAFIAWPAQPPVQRRHAVAMVAVTPALDAALDTAGDIGDQG
jgi:hypothetical protein